jgi:hypothetical protein
MKVRAGQLAGFFLSGAQRGSRGPKTLNGLCRSAIHAGERMKNLFFKLAIVLSLFQAVLFLGCPNPENSESLQSTEWRWEAALLEFKADNKVTIDTLGLADDREGYDYTYDNSTHKGAISGDPNRRGGQSAIDFPIVNELGPFTINGDTLTFSDYRESGISVSFSRRAGTVSGNDLNGTSWRFSRPPYDASKNMIGVLWYGPNFVIECLDDTNAILYALDAYYTSTSKLTYTYNDAGPSGNMSYVSGPLNGAPNAFTVRSPYTFDPSFEDFPWRGGDKNNLTAAHNLAFSNWKGYGHGWDFVKMDTSGIEQ